MHRLQRIPIPELADQLSEKSFKGDRIQSMGDGHPVQRLRERTHFKYGQGTVAFEQSPFSFLQEQRHVLQEHLLVRLIACNMLWTAHACPFLGEGADKVEVPAFRETLAQRKAQGGDTGEIEARHPSLVHSVDGKTGHGRELPTC